MLEETLLIYIALKYKKTMNFPFNINTKEFMQYVNKITKNEEILKYKVFFK